MSGKERQSTRKASRSDSKGLSNQNASKELIVGKGNVNDEVNTINQGNSNNLLRKASKAKKDEFYTQLSDIEKEVKHYKSFLKGKTIYCNCDDPYESNFFKYFAANFNSLGLKKLITTSFSGSPIVGGQLSLFDLEGLKPNGKEPFKIEITEVPDLDNDGAIGLLDVEMLLKMDKKAHYA